MVAGNGKTAAAAEGRPLDHIGHGPIVLNHVKIGRGETVLLVTEILGNG